MATSIWPLKGRFETFQRKLPNNSDRQALHICLFNSVSSRISLEHAFLDTAEVPGAKLHLIDQKLVPLDTELPHFIWVVVGVEVCPSIILWRLCHRCLCGWLLSCRARFGKESARGRCVAILSLRSLKY